MSPAAYWLLGLPLASLLAGPLVAQKPAPISDNSFLIEEAYNQDRVVVQHISLFGWQPKSRDWSYSFTQEWPLRNQQQQLSYGVAILRTGGSTGLGDLFLNYRIQALGAKGRRVWVAPRVSVVVPTGSWRAGRGNGVVGLELKLPGSFELAPWTTLHLNAGLDLYPRARSVTGERASLIEVSTGASIVVMLRPTFNLLIETVIENGAQVTGAGRTSRSTTVVVNPGLRWAHNLSSGLQIVPGISYSIGLGGASDQSAVLLYLSFEHPFKRE